MAHSLRHERIARTRRNGGVELSHSVGVHLQTWKLKLSTTKTVSTAFHTLSDHLTKTYVRRSGRITNGMWGGRTILQDSAFSSPTPAHTPRNDTPKNSLGAA